MLMIKVAGTVAIFRYFSVVIGSFLLVRGRPTRVQFGLKGLLAIDKKLRHLAFGKALYLFRSDEPSFLCSQMMPRGSMGRFVDRVADVVVRPQKNLRAQVSLTRRYFKREGFFKVI